MATWINLKNITMTKETTAKYNIQKVQKHAKI